MPVMSPWICYRLRGLKACRDTVRPNEMPSQRSYPDAMLQNAQAGEEV